MCCLPNDGKKEPKTVVDNNRICSVPEVAFALTINTLRTGDADLRFYVTTVQDG